jgi:hypothetical protein
MSITYAVQHPDMSEALIVEANEARTEKGLIAQCFMYMLKHFDVSLDTDEWMIKTIYPIFPTTNQSLDLFAADT